MSFSTKDLRLPIYSGLWVHGPPPFGVYDVDTWMEDILNLYERPYNNQEPVVCLDEKPIQLLSSKREGTTARPGYLAVQDFEYVRRGIANIFCGIEPLAGRHFIKATPNRKGPAFGCQNPSLEVQRQGLLHRPTQEAPDRGWCES